MGQNYKPLVSVVMNNYNNEPYLNEAIESILNQDYPNIELIIIDAFSSDRSRDIINSYASKYDNIRKIYVDKFEPYPSVTYNLGLINSRGSYIAIADSDDLSSYDRISKQVHYLENNSSVDIVGSDCYEFFGDMDNKKLISTSVINNVRHAAPPVRNPSIMLKKEILATYGLWDWKSEYAADYEWLYRMFIQGAQFQLISEPLLYYRKSLTNISHSRAIGQSTKLLKFKIYFGIKSLNIFNFFWLKSIFSSIIYLIILFIKKILKKI